MKTLSRLLALAVVGVGALLVGYSAYEGFKRGFGIDLDGNWDPFLAGLAGIGLLSAGALAYYVIAHTAPGVRFGRAVLRGLRSFAVALLVTLECAGVAMAVMGFLTFLALERVEERSGLAALAMCGCGVVAHFSARYLLPWVRGDKAPKKPEMFVADDRQFDDKGP